ncbi:MAG: alpha/beta hydrolase-fold protein, partial [Thermoanaerobaculaceae bacterium]|nr:alpha/beta hydrolase-fold protein [Thermoanaerobaculaceae bacterium]
MHRRTPLVILASAGVLALAVGLWRSPGAQRRDATASEVTALEAAIAEVEAGRKTTPIVGGPAAGGDATVTFLAKRAGGTAPRVVSDVTGWGEHADGTFDVAAGTMTRVERTEWYWLQANVAPGARIEYLIADGPADYRLDPHNPRQGAGPGFGGLPASEFVTPGYRPPPEFTEPATSPAGTTTEATVASRALGGPCRLIVYTPPGYRRDGAYPVAVFLDLRSGQVARVLDWLIAHRGIEPIVAVFVGPEPHGGEHVTGAPLRAFLTGELPAWLAARYGVTRTASGRAILGISFGAKDALDAALASGGSAGGFGRLGLLIPGRRIGPADIAAIPGRRGAHLRVAILAGRYDLANVATPR